MVPSGVLGQYLSLFGVCGGGGELLGCLVEVVELCVLSVCGGDARVVELGEGGEAGDCVE